MSEPWNRCDVCGRFIPYEDIQSGAARRQLEQPDSDFGPERYETLCRDHAPATEEGR